MIPCISVENMRRSDAYTIANLVPSLELMHRAAYGVFLSHRWTGPVAIVAGSGNNGGDGFALACILQEHNISCTVFALSQKLSQDSAFYADRAKRSGVPIRPFEAGCMKDFAEAVDCLLGTGFQGEVRENYRAAIEEINGSDAFVISVDINSGMNGDSGESITAVRSDLTVTIGFVKNGLITEKAGAFMKQLVCTDIGIALIQEENHICTAEEWQEKNDLPGYFLCPGWLDMDIIPAVLANE